MGMTKTRTATVPPKTEINILDKIYHGWLSETHPNSPTITYNYAGKIVSYQQVRRLYGVGKLFEDMLISHGATVRQIDGVRYLNCPDEDTLLWLTLRYAT